MNEVHDIVATAPARFEPDQVGQHAPYYTKTDNQRQVQFAVAGQGAGGEQEEDRRYRQTKLPCKHGSKHHRIAVPGEILDDFVHVIEVILVSACRVCFAGHVRRDMRARLQPVPRQQDRHQCSFSFFDEGHSTVTIAVDADEVSQLHLPGCDQVRQRENNMTLDGPLQVTSAILHVGPLADQELLYRSRAAEYELVIAGGLQNALLQHSQLDLEDLFQVFGAQGAEDHDLVDAVHELRRKLSPGGVHRGAIDLVVEPGVQVGLLVNESHGAVDEVAHLRCPKVGGHDDDALGKIDFTI